MELNLAEQLVLILLDKNKGEVPALRRVLLNQLLTCAVIQDLVIRGRIHVDPITPHLEVVNEEPVGDQVVDTVFGDLKLRQNPFRKPPMLDRVTEQLLAKNVLRSATTDGKNQYRLGDNQPVHDIIDRIKVAIADPGRRDAAALCLVNLLSKHLSLGSVLPLKGQFAALKAMRKTYSQREILVAMGLLPHVTPEQVAAIVEAIGDATDAIGDYADSRSDASSPVSLGGSRSPNDDRADSLNPNSAAFKASRENRSNQLNPNNPRYQK